MKAYRRGVVAGAQLPRGMNRFLPAILGVPASRVAEVWVTDRPRGSGRSHYGLSRSLVVLRDLLALRLLVLSGARRIPLRSAPRGTEIRRAVVLVGGILLTLGAAGGPLAGALISLTAVLAAGATAAIAYDVPRWVRGQSEGVFRVRQVL